MATIANITSVAAATGAAHSYILTTFTKVQQGATTYIAELKKVINPAVKSQDRFYGIYATTTSAAVATTGALRALNAGRKHRYAGNPGAADGATVVADLHGDTPVVDVS